TTSFSRFVPVEFLKSLKKENLTDIKLGDQVEKRMTILFSDIRSFTSLSETMSPKDNFKFLNSFLERMVPCILRNHGFVDKFVGDAIMALFPDNPADAISAAIDMQTEIQKMNKDMDIMVEKKISIGIGIHVGDLMLGTIGVTDRMETTVISDAVNVAARMERLTKLYNTGILITGDTLIGLDKFQSRYLDTVIVKGKNIPNSVYEILDGLEPNLLEQRIQSRDDFDSAVKNYRNGDIKKAKDQFEELMEKNNTDKTVELYIERCKHLLENGIPEHWDCIEKLSSK
ncbi:MAG: adenylate/guanylate cyclase domain-containing protein, partial [Deltaproteobacteria bacterium]|nr:adenylate/guanylate cyclase domain-containing protein [Deltaproteobacteria bacterium]